MNKVLGICNLHDSPSLGLLTKNRPLGALSFLSRYGLMDFTLSNFSNSQIDKIAILTESNTTAVLSHTQFGNVWINNTKTGFLRVVVNEKLIDSPKFNTDIANIEANYAIVQDADPDYILIAPSFFLMSIDFRKMIEAHQTSGADITCLYIRCKNAKKEFINCDCFDLEKNGTISHCGINVGEEKNLNISLETFVFNRAAFDRLITLSHKVSALYTIRKMVAYGINHKTFTVQSHEFTGYVVPILSSSDYVEKSFELLSYANRARLFDEEWPIYTTTHNTPPALYGETANVMNSIIGNGAIIKGTVENSIISRDVVVEEGAVVRNCILFTKSHIHKNVHMEYVLTDKNVDVSEVTDICGKKDKPLIIKLGEKI